MTKKILIVIALWALLGDSRVHAQSYEWAKAPSCSSRSGGSEGWTVASAPNGTVYTAGFYWGDSTCTDTTKHYNTTDPTRVQTLLLAYSPQGRQLWSISSTNGQSRPIGIATDKQSNLWVYGFFDTDSIMFGHTTLHNSGYSAAVPNNNCYYLLKYDTAGTLLWAVASQSHLSIAADYLQPGAIATDPAGNCYITGSYTKPNFTIESYLFTNHGGSAATADIFLAKYSPNGALLWAKNYGGADNDYTMAAVVSPQNRLWIAGKCKGNSINFGSTNLFTTVECGFLVGIDSVGNTVTAQKWIGQSNVGVLATDSAGNVYAAGGFTGSSVEKDGYTLENAYGGYYLAYLNSAGRANRLIGMLPRASATGCCALHGLAIDPCHNAWLCLNVDRVAGITIDSGITINAPTAIANPLLLVGYSPAGKSVAYRILPSGAGDHTGLSNTGIAIADSGGVYIGGDYQGIDKFIVGSDTLIMHNEQVSNLFVAKLRTNAPRCDTSIPPPAVDTPGEWNFYPNPANTYITAQYTGSLKDSFTLKISNTLGQAVATYYLSQKLYSLNVDALLPGVYYAMLFNHTTRQKRYSKVLIYKK